MSRILGLKCNFISNFYVQTQVSYFKCIFRFLTLIIIGNIWNENLFYKIKTNVFKKKYPHIFLKIL